MDVLLILLVIAIVVVGLFFKDFKSVVYFIGIVDIFFRLIYKVASLLGIPEFSNFISKYLPNSIEAIINYYSSGILNTILIWLLVAMYIYFEWYLIKYWIKKKK